jgi:hypothetical protein
VISRKNWIFCGQYVFVLGLFVWFPIMLWGQNVKIYNGVHGYTFEVPKTFSRLSTIDFDVYAPILYKNNQVVQRAKKSLSEGNLDVLIAKEDTASIKVASENIKIQVDENFKTIVKQELPKQYFLLGRTNCTIEECDFKKINNKNALYMEISYTENNKSYFAVLAFLNGRDNIFTTINMVVGKNNQKKYSSIFKKALQTLVIK